MNEKELKKMEELCEKATPENWYVDRMERFIPQIRVSCRVIDQTDDNSVCQMLRDSVYTDYVLKASTAVPKLIAEIRRLRSLIEQGASKSMLELLKDYRDEVRQLREALEFYADKGNYILHSPVIHHHERLKVDIVTAKGGVCEDDGNRARKALRRDDDPNAGVSICKHGSTEPMTCKECKK